jgi:carbonic anhydrase
MSRHGEEEASNELRIRERVRSPTHSNEALVHGEAGGAVIRAWRLRNPSGDQPMSDRIARAALARLQEGNQRFASNARGADAAITEARRASLTAGQEPFAIVLGCSDSRVPAEIVFDQGLGDLFVIRVAGNIVAPSQIGSVEFAAARFGTRLVVVLGHTQCGAIVATLDELRRPTASQSPNLRSIVNRIRPAVEELLATPVSRDEDALVRAAVRANIQASVDELQHGSPILEQLVREEGLLIVGAEYCLESGVVQFLGPNAS